MSIILLCFFISTSVLFLAVYNFFRNRRVHKLTAHIPGPLYLPLIRNGYIMIGSPEFVFKQLYELLNFYGSPVKISFGPRVWVLIKNPEQIKTVLRSIATVEKDGLYQFLALAVSNGLLTSEHKIWKQHRKLLQPTLSAKILQSFSSIFQKNSLLLIRAVKKHVGCPEFELSPYIFKAIFFNTFESIVGLSSKMESENNIEIYLNNINRLLVFLFDLVIKTLLSVDIIVPFGHIISKKYLMPVKSYTDSIIQKKRETIQRSSSHNNKDSFLEEFKSPLEFMIKLTEKEGQFSDKELRDHTLTLLIASYDTSARALNFMFLMLAFHPEIQDGVYDEIFNIYGDEDVESNPVKYEDLQKLTYLERVIKETLRLFPIVPLIGRQATEDFDLDGYFIPKDCGIIINILALHRDEKIWPDPLKFDPDRFLPEAMAQQHPCDYIPFSYGSRNCIGRMYGMMSMKILAANFLRTYVVKKDKILPVKDIRLKMDILLQSAEPVKIRIEERVKHSNKETGTTYL